MLILDYLVNRYSYNKIYYSSWLPSSKYTDIYILVHVPSLSGLDIKTLFTMVEKLQFHSARVCHAQQTAQLKLVFCSFLWMDPSTNFFFLAKIKNNTIVDCFFQMSHPRPTSPCTVKSNGPRSSRTTMWASSELWPDCCLLQVTNDSHKFTSDEHTWM